MASVFKPAGRTIYRIEFRDQHDRIRTVSSGMKDRKAAKSLGSKLEEDAELIRAGRQPRHPRETGPLLGLTARSDVTWKQFRERYEAEYLSGQRPNTREKAGAVFDVLEEEMRPVRLRDLDGETVSQFAAALRRRPVVCRGKPTGQVGLAPWSIKNYLIAIKTALGWAVKQKLLTALPVFPKIKVPKKTPQPIAEEDWHKLLDAAPDERWRAYLLCGWWGGLRLSEARHLRRGKSEEWPWVDWAADRIILPAVFAKSDQDQWIPLHPRLHEALAALPVDGDEFFPFRSRLTGGPLSRPGLTQYVRNLAKKAGVKLSMHKLRKGFGCRVAQQLGKGNAPVLHRLMRHSSMQVTMDFYASVDDVLHDAIRQLDPTKEGEAQPGEGPQEKAG